MKNEFAKRIKSDKMENILNIDSISNNMMDYAMLKSDK